MTLRRLAALGAAAAMAGAVVLAFWYAQAPPATRVKAGQQAPDVELSTQGGRTRLSSLRGGPVLLVIFDARWPVSRTQLLEIERLHRWYRPLGLVVIGVALDEDTKALRSVLSTLGVTFVVFEDPRGRTVGSIYGLPERQTPLVYLIAADGRVEAVFVRQVNWRARDVRGTIERLLPPEHPAPSRR